MVGEASLPAPLCGPSSPSVHATTREGGGEQGGVGVEEVSNVSCVCVCSSANFFRPKVFTVCCFLALCLGVVMGPFVGTAFFLGTTSTPEEEVEEEEDEEEEELSPSSEDVELSLLLDES